MAELNERHVIFIDEWLKDFNGARAARVAGFKESAARTIASELLAKPDIQDEISRRLGKRLKKLEISSERVLAEIAKIAFYDPRNFFNPDGTAKHIMDLDDDTAAALAGLEIYEEYGGKGENRALEGYTKKFRLADKIAALDKLGRYLKLFTDRVEHEGGIVLKHSVSRPER